MSNLTYGSVCSGIEAASAAWEPIGMSPAWFAEIEPFPAAVLKYHWPCVINLGDMTAIADPVSNSEVAAPDILVGGTPCQAFSVAGARRGLADERGALTIKYVELLDAIDSRRIADGKSECIAVWENVPGVLSSKDNAFGAFLGLLAGEDCELQPPGGKWSNAGFVLGPQRAIAWRILDAQYFGVAQRRRRVFVVASARKGFDPAKVLFESEGLRRDIAPSREAQQEATTITRGGVKSESHWDGQRNPHPTLNQSHNTGGIGSSNQEVFSQRGAGLVACYRMAAFGEYADDETASTMKARDYKDATDLVVSTVSLRGDLAGTLRASSGGGDKPHALVATPIQNATRGKSQNGIGIGSDIDPMYTLDQASQHGVFHSPSVRRLTPIECERLQGFPDNHTQIPWRNKPAEDCPDGHRYKAVGNSMAVPVMRWIGKRIQAQA